MPPSRLKTASMLRPSTTSIRRKSAPVAWLLAVLLGFAPLGQHAAGAVLCIEADGRIAAEAATGAACDSDEAPVSGASHGGSCTDVPLPSGGDADCAAFKAESGPTAQVFLSVVAVLPALAPTLPGDRRDLRVSDSSLQGLPGLASLRSVVLLI